MIQAFQEQLISGGLRMFDGQDQLCGVNPPPLQSPPVCIVKILENMCKRLLGSDLIGLKLSLR